MAATVYFTDFRAPSTRENLPQKLKRLIKTAGIEDIDFDGKYTAIKIHFGEPGNMAYLRPNWAKALADVIRDQVGKPYLTDCNTLYVGGRTNALDHIDSAYENGYNPFTTGCHVIIADGIKGSDEALVPVAGGEYVKEAKIGKAIMDADVFISLSHFKGHEATGFGGAIKNIGMGCGSRAGKMEQHSDGKPKVSKSRCVGCHICETWCAHDAVKVTDGKAVINQDTCVGCGRCLTHCPVHAVYAKEDATAHSLNSKMAEYTKAVVDGRPCFHISLVLDVSPLCDCYATNDTPIVQDIGMFASFDPVALDQACADAVNALCPASNSQLEPHSCDHDHFHHLHPDTDWEHCLDHCEKLGIGTRKYTLITI